MTWRDETVQVLPTDLYLVLELTELVEHKGPRERLAVYRTMRMLDDRLGGHVLKARIGLIEQEERLELGFCPDPCVGCGLPIPLEEFEAGAVHDVSIQAAETVHQRASHA